MTEPYRDPTLTTAERVADLLARMTVEEKVGQIVQGDIASITPDDVRAIADIQLERARQAWACRTT